jgi:hypothetical protein
MTLNQASPNPADHPIASQSRPSSRRRFLEIATAAGGAALLSAGLSSSKIIAASAPASGHGVEALVLNCIDYRLANDVTFFLSEHALTNKYDQIALAGSTLGVATDKYPAWAETFWQHLDLAVKQHKVRRVIAINHRDCDAFKLAFDKDFAKSPSEETEAHRKVLADFRKQVWTRFPLLEVELLLMRLDGHCQAFE